MTPCFYIEDTQKQSNHTWALAEPGFSWSVSSLASPFNWTLKSQDRVRAGTRRQGGLGLQVSVPAFSQCKQRRVRPSEQKPHPAFHLLHSCSQPESSDLSETQYSQGNMVAGQTFLTLFAQNYLGFPDGTFCHFMLFIGFSRKEYWSGLPFPSPADQVLSELSTMTHPFWVALYGMAYSFTELDKTVVYVVSLASFLWLWFSFCLPSDG